MPWDSFDRVNGHGGDMHEIGWFCARLVFAAGLVGAGAPCLAAEGTTAAGPIAGTDIRSAMLPPPGFYGGIIGLNSHVPEVVDGKGNPVPGLDAVDLTARVAAPFFVYVPDVQVLGGSVGLIGLFPGGQECGQAVSAIPSRCTWGMGDPYFELAWSRSFGQLRPSRYPGALPILEGLVIGAGIGVVAPFGKYEPQLRATNGITLGNNIYDVAPSIAMTYTTPPLIAEGTEFSAKLYWNNYAINPDTRYLASPLVDVDFAVSERIGRFQLGLAGVYLSQTGEDRQFGAPVPPDGRRLEYLALGGVVNYDMPEIGAAFRAKMLSTILGRNTGISQVFAVGFAKKLF
jgi:hypothetical protein